MQGPDSARGLKGETMKLIGNSSITSKSPVITGISETSVAAKGCMVRLLGGSEMIDFVMGLHGALGGYSPAWWVEAVVRGAENASSSIAAFSEKLATAELAKFYPWAEAVRFMADGSSPNEAAVRIARAATRENKIAFCGYHGTGTSFPHNPDTRDREVDERRGIPKEMWRLTEQFRWGDFEALARLPDRLAALIVEVPPRDYDAPDFLKECRYEASKRGAVFIIDDVVTGFRVAPGGASEAYGVIPDLCCLGKALGNGFNVSALIGNENLMELLTQGVHFSSTFAGNGLACEAVVATLRWMWETKPLPAIYETGTDLKWSMNNIFQAFQLPMVMTGNSTRPIVESTDPEILSNFLRGMKQNGVYCLASPWYITAGHTPEIIKRTLEIAEIVCGGLRPAA